MLAGISAVCQQLPPSNPPLTSANRPFSLAVEAGDTLYVSGHLGLDNATGKPPADPAVEARLVMTEIRTTLEQYRMTTDDLVSVQVFCTDLSLFSLFNKEYVTFFHKPYPARAFLGVKDLLYGARFEVMGTAVRHAGESKKQPPAAP